MQGKNEWTTLGKTLKYILRNVNSCPNPENTSTLSQGTQGKQQLISWETNESPESSGLVSLTQDPVVNIKYS